MTDLLELNALLGRAYAAIVLKKADGEQARQDFKKAMEDKAFMAVAQARRAELEALERRVGIGALKKRDFCSAVYLEFLREMLAGS